jgi:hypothetical protein
MSRDTRLAQILVRHAAYLDPDQMESKDLDGLLDQLRSEYSGLRIHAYESPRLIELTEIEVVEKGQGVGTAVIRRIQDYARQVGKPIVLRPHPEPRKKAALFRFYKNLGFVVNKGRNMDYTLSSPFALTMYWKP